MKNIAVFFGGKSVEHDISIITGLQAIKAIDKDYNIIPIYIKSNGEFITSDSLKNENVFLDFETLSKKNFIVSFAFGLGKLLLIKKKKIVKMIEIDCALLCNHGHGGEDGSLQGLLELAEIPYTSCNVLSSSLCMDKALTKIVLEEKKIKTPKFIYFNKNDFSKNKDKILEKINKSINFPCIIKPSSLGSSVGINVSHNDNECEKYIGEAFKYDDKVIIEKFLDGSNEFCCAVIKLRNNYFTSNIKIVSKGEIYSFNEKYIENKEEEQKGISKKLENLIKQKAIDTYKALECDGVVRVDFLQDAEGIFVNEVNSIPGSLAFNLFPTSFNDLLHSLIDESIMKYKNKKMICYKFNSEAIKSYIDTIKNNKKFSK